MGLNVPLSVLDVAPVADNITAGDALRNSLDLAARAEAMGYRRYWVAEHHNMAGIASSAPAVLIAHLAMVTKQMRIGSGGVMLPNHSSLSIAEQFGMLEALHPGRIDLAIGRAPGTDALTARALRRGPIEVDEFPQQLNELIGYFTGSLPDEHPFSAITATPALGNLPPMWLLGSSDYGAQVAGYLGWPFAFAHHFSPGNTMTALAAYRESFRPSERLKEPYAMIAASVLCADTDERAQFLAGSGRLSFLRMRTGRPGRSPSPEEAAAYQYTEMEKAAIRSWTSSHIIGSPATVEEGLRELLARTRVDELMITSGAYCHEERVRSYELVAAMTA